MAGLNDDHFRVLLAIAVSTLVTSDGTVSRPHVLDELALRPHIDLDESITLLVRLGLIVADGEKLRVTERAWDAIHRRASN
jgi:hypothetical protein